MWWMRQEHKDDIDLIDELTDEMECIFQEATMSKEEDKGWFRMPNIAQLWTYNIISKILSNPNLYCLPSSDFTLTSEFSKNSAQTSVLFLFDFSDSFKGLNLQTTLL